MNVYKNHIVLTGATGGIGRVLAAELAGRGATLTLVGRDQIRLNLLKEKIDGKHHTVVADLSTPDGRQKLVQALDVIGEPIDILINNAGVSELSLYDMQSEQQIEQIILLNLLTPMLLTHSLLPRLRTSSASVLNVGSTFGSIAYPGFTAYSASKFGLRGFSEGLNRELSDRNILVQYAAPRATRTSLNSAVANQLNTRLGNRTDEPVNVAVQLCDFIESGKNHCISAGPKSCLSGPMRSAAARGRCGFTGV